MYLYAGSARARGVGDCTCLLPTLNDLGETSGPRIDRIPPTRPPWWRRQYRDIKKLIFLAPSKCPIDLFGPLANGRILERLHERSTLAAGKTLGIPGESGPSRSTPLAINELPDTLRRRPVTQIAAQASPADDKRSSSARNRPEAPITETRAGRRQDLRSAR